MLPGLVIEETGSGEMSGTKYMKEAIGFPGNWSWPKSNRMVGPVAGSVGRIIDGEPAWPNADSKPFDQSTSASSITLAPHQYSNDAAQEGEHWFSLVIIMPSCCQMGRRPMILARKTVMLSKA